MHRHLLALPLTLLACACGGARRSPATETPPSPPPGPTYEVHEWGLVQGTLADRISISGPHVDAPPMPVAKPVLYFHRHGEGALVVDVEARIPNGRIVEHWPYASRSQNDSVRWEDVVIQDGACRGSRYPSLGEEPCRSVYDGCEAATLAEVETRDASCVFWPRPPDEDGPTQAWNHLFYRGEITSAPSLPLHAELLPDGGLRVTHRGSAPVPGHVLRIRRANGTPGVADAITVGAPPAPGESIVLASPNSPISSGRAELGAALREAGLTQEEVEAFGRAWDATLFGPGVTGQLPSNVPTTTTAMPMSMIMPTPTTSLLYVLPQRDSDALATLTFSPPPTTVRRAIVVWIAETSAR